MAYNALDTASIEVGDPVKKELFDTIRANQESFNTDIEALKQTATIDMFNIRFNGHIDQYSTSEINSRSPVFKAPVSGTIVSFTITLLEASTSGTISVEIDRSSDDGVNWTPLLSSPVTLSGTTVGSLSGSVNFVDVPSQSFTQSDLIRIRFNSVQVGQGDFQVHMYAELS